MRWITKNKLGLKFFAVGLAVALAMPGFSSELKSARVYPTGKITIYRGDQKIGEYHNEAPFPEGFLIAADGRCGVKMDDMYLVAEDQSIFAVETAITRRQLLIRKGTVYFALPEKSRKLSFVTPGDTVTVQGMMLNAATGNPLLKGYISVNQDRSEIGVVEGGAMMISTRQGDMLIKSGQRLILAQAELDVGPPEEEKVAEEEEIEKEPGLSRGQKITIGAVGAGATLAAFFALLGGGSGGSSGGDGGGDDDVSPSSP